MAHDRPSVVAAKFDKLAEIVAEADDLKQMDAADRPGGATLNEVRAAYRDAVREIRGPKGSVAEVEAIKCPCDRLAGGTA
jgi:hypothetical protein